MAFIEPCFGIGHNLSLMTSEDIKHQLIIIIYIYIKLYAYVTRVPVRVCTS